MSGRNRDDDRDDEYRESYSGPPRSFAPEPRDSQDSLFPPDMTPGPEDLVSMAPEDLVSAPPDASIPPSVDEVVDRMQRIAEEDLADVDDQPSTRKSASPDVPEDIPEEEHDDDIPPAETSDAGEPIPMTKRRKHLPRAPKPKALGVPQKKASKVRHDSGSNIPKLYDLKRQVLDSMPPVDGAFEAAMRDDALFTAPAVHEDVFGSLLPAEREEIEPPPSSGKLAVMAAMREVQEREAQEREQPISNPPSTPSSKPRSKRRISRSPRKSPSPPAPAVAPSAPSAPPAQPSQNGRILYAVAMAFVVGIAATLIVERVLDRRDTPAPLAANTHTAPPPPVPPPAATETETKVAEPQPVSSGDPEIVDDWSGVVPSARPTASVAPWPNEITTDDTPEPEPSATPSATAEPSAKPAAEPGEFDKAAAQAAVASAAASASGCADGTNRGRAPMSITFAPSGKVTQATIQGGSVLAGTSVGSCIARTMQSARVPPFKGGPVTVTKTVVIN